LDKSVYVELGVEVEFGSGGGSRYLLLRSMSAFFSTRFEYLAPMPLIAVMAYWIFRFPSMFVFRSRMMYWNWLRSGTTKLWS
jgi:hypothetical protein